jgi:hypothetical protein
MANVRALRGVCIGVNRHLAPGETADVDASTLTFLRSIGAVEVVAEPTTGVRGEKFDKMAQDKPMPATPGKKEKTT